MSEEEKKETTEEEITEKPEEMKEKTTDEAATPSSEETKTEAETEKKEETGAPVEDPAVIAAQEEAAKQQAKEEALEAEEIGFPDLRSGMTIRLHQKIKEGNKERIQVFQGIVIALRGKTLETKTVTLQKKSFGVMVEKIFPLASPLIEKIEVVKIAKVRRAKLYYLTDYKKRLKETLVKQS